MESSQSIQSINQITRLFGWIKRVFFLKHQWCHAMFINFFFGNFDERKSSNAICMNSLLTLDVIKAERFRRKRIKIESYIFFVHNLHSAVFFVKLSGNSPILPVSTSVPFLQPLWVDVSLSMTIYRFWWRSNSSKFFAL